MHGSNVFNYHYSCTSLNKMLDFSVDLITVEST